MSRITSRSGELLAGYFGSQLERGGGRGTSAIPPKDPERLRAIQLCMALIPTAFFFGDTPPSPGVIVGKFVPLSFRIPTPAPDYRPFFFFCLFEEEREISILLRHLAGPAGPGYLDLRREK